MVYIALYCNYLIYKSHEWARVQLWGWQTSGVVFSYPRCSRSSTDPSGSGPPRSCGQSRCRSGSWSDTSRGSKASSRCPRRWSWGWRRRKLPPWSAASSRPGCTASCRISGLSDDLLKLFLVFNLWVGPVTGEQLCWHFPQFALVGLPGKVRLLLSWSRQSEEITG